MASITTSSNPHGIYMPPYSHHGTKDEKIALEVMSEEESRKITEVRECWLAQH
jgi:hypothetical protein